MAKKVIITESMAKRIMLEGMLQEGIVDDVLKSHDFETKVKNMAYDIIKKKGNTSYGIGMATTRVTNAILSNENAILTISSYDEENDLFIGYPTIINKDGAVKRLPFPLNNNEQQKYDLSIKALKDVIQKIK